jgi:hypothetical protein
MIYPNRSIQLWIVYHFTYIKRFFKQEIYHRHCKISGYRSSKQFNINIGYTGGHKWASNIL